MSNNQQYTKLLTNPSEDLILFTISMALEDVQKDVRLRKLRIKRSISGYETIFQLPVGKIQQHGGSPNKSDGSYSTGQTTRLGIAWWTDRTGNKHIRITADRTQASNFSVPDIFSHISEPFDIVFPKHDSTCTRCGYEFPTGEGYWEDEDRFSCDVCYQEDKYFDETGFLPPGRRKRRK